MRFLLGALGFFTTIPVGRDERSFESLRRNLWVLPLVGAVIGFLIGIPLLILKDLDLPFLGVLVYLAIEGVNHVDGLADFGDAFFATKDRKLKALKDLNLGVGGVLAVALYIAILTKEFELIDNIVALIDSQMMAKFGMLFLLTTTKPIWDGMASYMMEFARRRDLIVGAILVTFVSLTFGAIFVNLAVVFLCFAYRFYVIRTFGGVNGDMIGALNCIIFAFTLLLWVIFSPSACILFPLSAC